MKNLFFLFLFSFAAQAQMRDQTISYENPEGQKLSSQVLADQALKQLAEQLVIEFIGVDSFTKNKAVVTTKVINQANKFTPFQKVQGIERGDFGSRITVQFQVSLVDFRKLLSDAGLFAKTRIASDVIAFLSLENSSGERVSSSWSPDPVSDQKVSLQVWQEEFKKSFDQSGYFYNRNINPAWLNSFKNSVSVQDVIAKNTNTESLILWGQAKLSESEKSGETIVTAQIKIYSQKLKKEVTDSIRRWRLKDLNHRSWSTWAQELILQIDEVDPRSLSEGSSLLISVKGNLSLIQQDSVKSWILSVSPSIQSATERGIAQDMMSFEVDTTSTVDLLAGRMAGLTFKGSPIKVSKSSNAIQVEILP